MLEPFPVVKIISMMISFSLCTFYIKAIILYQTRDTWIFFVYVAFLEIICDLPKIVHLATQENFDNNSCDLVEETSTSVNCCN